MESTTDMTPTLNDRIILCMGQQFSGKRQVVNWLTEQESRDNYENASYLFSRREREPVELCFNRVTLDGHSILFVQIPGFGGAGDDMAILRIIYDWLGRIHRLGVTQAVTAILYHLPITINRIDPMLRQDLQVLMRICGSASAKKIVLITTMWEKMDTQERIQEAESKHRQLQSDEDIKLMISKGATTIQFANSSETAREIINGIVCMEVNDRPLLLQHEIVNLNKEIRQTTVGKSLQKLRHERMLTQSKDALVAIERPGKVRHLAGAAPPPEIRMESVDWRDGISWLESLRLAVQRWKALVFRERERSTIGRPRKRSWVCRQTSVESL